MVLKNDVTVPPPPSLIPLYSQNVHFTKNMMSDFIQQKQEKISFHSSDQRPLKKKPIFVCFAFFSLQLPNGGLLADGLIDGDK